MRRLLFALTTTTRALSLGGASGAGGRSMSHPFKRLTRLMSTTVPLTSDATISVSGLESVEKFEGDAIVLPFVKDGVKVEGVAASVDDLVDGAVSELAEDFKGTGSSSIRLSSKSFVKSVALCGVGSGGGRFEQLGAYLAELSESTKAKSILVAPLEGASWSSKDVESVSRGAMAAKYVDNRFRTGDNVAKPAPLEAITFLGIEKTEDSAAAAAADVAAGVALCRDVVGAPANVVTPGSLADIAMGLCEDSTCLTGTVLDRAECEKRGMGSFLGVADGANDANAAKFIHLTYTGESSASDKKKKTLVLIGKGLTYDSGGYNLKPSAGGMIEKMKFDCGGSAAVLGAAKAISLLKIPDVDVHFIVAACENMVGPDAMRPGDILTASNGKTIEVINTDAEGRLTLADALIYAENECKPDAIVDVATLTGACIIALGDKVAGLFTPHDTLSKQLEDAAEAAGEKVWRLPMTPEYDEQIKSKIADLKNVGGRAGGSITAALFLKHFVSDSLPWAHLDIAGPVWDDKKDAATGFGVKTLVEWVRTRAAANEE